MEQIADVGVSPSTNLKLLSSEIIFVSIPTYVIMVRKRQSETDGRTGDILWHKRAASRSKNRK